MINEAGGGGFKGGPQGPLVSDAAGAASQPPAGSAHQTVLRDSYWADTAADAVSEEHRTPTSRKFTSIVVYYTAVHAIQCNQFPVQFPVIKYRSASDTHVLIPNDT